MWVGTSVSEEPTASLYSFTEEEAVDFSETWINTWPHSATNQNVSYKTTAANYTELVNGNMAVHKEWHKKKLKIKNWTNCIQDRKNSKLYVEKAKTFKEFKL
jgi:hypothetical protein